MIHIFYPIDVSLFYWINNGWSMPALDVFFRLLTQSAPLVSLALAVGLWMKDRTRARTAIIAIVLSWSFMGIVAAHGVKPLVHRIRPCNALEHVLTPKGAEHTFSFPSDHSTISAALAVAVGIGYPGLLPFLIPYALLLGLSRIYLGLHYPTDVVVGFVLGTIFGWLSWRISKIIEGRIGPSA